MNNSTGIALRLLPRLRAWFGLSQIKLGYCLGLSKTMVSQVERGMRGLPMGAVLPQAALALAQQSTPEEPAAEALDTRRLRRRQQACQLRADRLTEELQRLAERATWARRRLAALPVLWTALTPGGKQPPSWLNNFASEARNELVRSGSTAQALMRAKQTALLLEAAEIDTLLRK